MVAVTLIIDGASEPLGAGPSSLERARTPVLDSLARAGELTRLRTIPAGLPAGSETAIPVLLGWTPRHAVDRGALEAAARRVPLADGHRAWRIDVLDGGGARAGEAEVERAARQLRERLHRHAVRRIGGHRLLVTGPPPLDIPADPGLRRWPEGPVPPRVLDAGTVMIAAPGAAAGVARLMGARVVVPDGATGMPDTDLAAKADAATRAIAEGARRVVVHVGAADEAAHQRDAEGKIAAIERIDLELVAPLVRAVASVRGTLAACPDHGCDPRTGLHDDAPVPHLAWRAGAGERDPRLRLTERAVASLDVAEPSPVWGPAA